MNLSLPRRLLRPLLSRLHVRSIRGQLALGFTLSLVPTLVLGSYLTNQYVKSRVYNLTQSRLEAESELIAYGLALWGLGISHTVQALADTPPFREGRDTEIQSTLDALGSKHSARLWRYWTTSTPPSLVASSDQISAKQETAAELNQDSRQYFQAARRGYATYQVVLSKTTGTACLNVAQPVYRSHGVVNERIRDIGNRRNLNLLMTQPVNPDVTGVIVMCIPLNTLGDDLRMQDLFKDKRLRILANDSNRDFLHDPAGFDSAVILVSNSGQLLFPQVDWTSNRLPTVDELSQTQLPSLLPIAQRAIRGEEVFTRVSGHGHNYLALTASVDSAWSLILLLNEEKATAEVRAIGHVQVAMAVLTLIVILLTIYIRSRSISQPISTAGAALGKISTGDFDVQIPPTTDDEIGSLLLNIQHTADRLKCYLKETTQFAITQKQIDTAKSIQKDFLLPVLPADPTYDVQAFSRPALEIGADWYDMVDAGDYAVLIVADVCDKGVPSALYMSVFRSLIRSKLLDSRSLWASSASVDASISEAIEQTNNYMASNHNSSMMFATVLVAAVNKQTGRLDYICAGHEPPVLCRSTNLEMLSSVSGPAIGLFESAHYSAFSLMLSPGDTLVIYSDGLVDARNSADEGWGGDRLRQLLGSVKADSADNLMRTIVSTVDEHMVGADQFDDLTVMVFRWLGA